MHADKVLDVKGLSCPMPVVKAKKAIDELQSGQVLEIQATDQGAKNDLTAWARSSGHTLLETKETADVLTFFIRKG